MTASTLIRYPSCPLYSSCPIRPGRPRRLHSLAAILLGLIAWGVVLKMESGVVTEHLGVNLNAAAEPANGSGRYVHPRRR